MSKKHLTLAFLSALLILAFLPIKAFAAAQQPTEVPIYFFWGDGCPHCAEEEPYLESLVQKYPQVKIEAYEVWKDVENQDLLLKVSQKMGFEAKFVPVTIIGEKYWIGFNEKYKTEFETALQACIASGCPDALADAGLVKPEVVKNSDQVIDIPIFGEVDLAKQSLVMSTLIIGFVDGFNPCSLWVLSVLLALTLYSGSRTKIITVGLTYLIVTAIIYSLFILGVFTLFSFVGYLKWIQVGVALAAIVFGVVNMKDYLWYKEGVSFTISDKHKPKLYQNMRSTVVNPRTMLGLIASTAALAVGVSLIEFSCTAGFPVIWSNLMIANKVPVASILMLLALYMLIYLLDEIAIFIAAAVTMKAAKMEEKHGRVLKLISGTLMLALGIVMAVNPGLMNNLKTSLMVFGIALLLTVLIYIVHQKVLPAMGIYIGSGFKKESKKKKH